MAPNPRNKMTENVSKNMHSTSSEATPLGNNHNNTYRPKYTMAPSQPLRQGTVLPPLMKGYWPPITPCPLPTTQSQLQLPVPPLMSKWPHIYSSTPCSDPQFQQPPQTSHLPPGPERQFQLPPLMNNCPPTYMPMPLCPNPGLKNQPFQPISNWPPASSTPCPETEAQFHSQSPNFFPNLKLSEFVYNAVSDDELDTIKHTLYLVSELQHFVSNRNASINQPIPKDHFWIEVMELSRTTVITFQMFQVYVQELWEAVHYEQDQSQILKIVLKIRDQLGLVYWSIVPLEAMIVKFYKAMEIGDAITPSVQYPSLIYRAPNEIISARLIYVPPTRQTSHLRPMRLYNPYPYEFDLEAIPDKSPRDIGERANRITELLFKDPESFLSNKLRKVLQSKGNLKKHAQWEQHYISNRIAKQSTKSQREPNVSTAGIVNQNRIKQLKSLPEQLIASVSASENGKAAMPLMEIVFGQNDYHGFVEDGVTARRDGARGYSKGKNSIQSSTRHYGV